MTESGDDASHPDPHRFTEGTRVEVRTGFDGTWSSGFVVSAISDGGYRVRRRSDGHELPVVFPRHEIRRERRNAMWWF